MRSIRLGLILLIGFVPAFAGDVSGAWKVWFVGDGPLPKSAPIGFDFSVWGDKLSGEAILGSWGGFSWISGGKVDGDRISFAVVRRQSPQRVDFEGTMEGGRLKISTSDPAGPRMEGVKVDSLVVGPVRANASAADINGTWKTWFVGPMGPRPKMFAEVILDLKLEGNTLTGGAHMGDWPGDAPISDGHYEAGRFSFIVVGRSPSSSGYPKFHFEGTVYDDGVRLTMAEVSGHALPLDGKKVE